MNNFISESVLSALVKFYKYRQKNKMGGMSNFFPLYLLEHMEDYEKLINMLEDDISRELVKWFIEFRFVNSLLLDKEKTQEIIDPLLCKRQQLLLKADAETHAGNSLNLSLDVDVIENWLLEGYNLPGICEPELGDVVMDVGAFNGNSSLYFAGKVKESGKVIAIEPDPVTYESLQHNIEIFQDNAFADTITTLNIAISNQEGTLRFRRQGAASRVDPNGDISVNSRTLDSIVDELSLDKLDLLKFDIEGYEKEALSGAVRTIKMFRPKLMICIYHLHMDIVEIPKLVKEITPWYKFFIRHHASHDGELVLYCIPNYHHVYTTN